MQRTFKKLIVIAGGTPQPVFGTRFTGGIVPGLNPDAPLSIVVDDSSIFVAREMVCVSETDGTKDERVSVFDIPDATHIRVTGLKTAHAANGYVRCASCVASVYVQTINGNAASLFIGNAAGIVKATFAKVIALLQPVAAPGQPTEFSTNVSGLGNGQTASEYWIDGTTNDGFVPSFITL